MALQIALGFGLGRAPKAPGTFGTLLGLPLLALLLFGGSAWIYWSGIVAGFFVSVWAGGRAEKILGQKDPGSIVVDEYTALPLCFAVFLYDYVRSHHGWPQGLEWLSARSLLAAVVVFALFRLFDIWKPWPIRRSQDLPGGWGLTVDDYLAAIYVNGVCWLLLCLIR